MKIAVYLFLSLMLFSCTKTEHVDSEAVYQSLTPDQQDVWDYFIRYNNTPEVATVGVTELLDLGGQISGFDQLRVPFSFYGDVLVIDDMFNDLDYNPRMRPSRTKIFFSEGGFYEYIYYDRIPSKTRPGITYNVDFEIL